MGGAVFELGLLSQSNYRRHRVARYSFGVAGAAALAGLTGLGVWASLDSTSRLIATGRFFDLGAAVFVGYLCLSALWIPFRYLAPPPVVMEVRPEGLCFRSSTGKLRTLRWEDKSLRIELLARTGPPKMPAEASFRLWSMGGGWDYSLVWRRVMPIAYLTSTGFDAVLVAAQAAHMRIARIEHAGSLSFLPSAGRTAFLISPLGS
jgi:hypothetical protein